MAVLAGRKGGSVTPGPDASASSSWASWRPRAADFTSAPAALSDSPSGQPSRYFSPMGPEKAALFGIKRFE